MIRFYYDDQVERFCVIGPSDEVKIGKVMVKKEDDTQVEAMVIQVSPEFHYRNEKTRTGIIKK